MRWLSMGVAMIIVAISLAASPAFAQTCQQLWTERNQYYKNHGYCFKTPRAIDYFGNGGCYINDENAVPLTPAERARIAQIVQQERAMGCNIDGGGGTTGMTCDQLWVARNSIYKLRGYCFKTQRAIQYFGNSGCIYQNEGDVPFTPADRALIAQYVAQERAQGCQ
ncbi:MAG TPA: YARHG domain-containing protein [Hyphomicrobiaceae bacterium]|jgi:YARHG domain|nr:YARHG domain-containing protein [Hyphomicrobiaceae bacterium]